MDFCSIADVSDALFLDERRTLQNSGRYMVERLAGLEALRML
jgi:hypothetical protein